MKPMIYFLGFVFLIASCSSGGLDMMEEKTKASNELGIVDQASSDAVSDEQAPPPPPAPGEEIMVETQNGSSVSVSNTETETKVVKTPDKIIKTGNMTLVVEEYDSAISQIKGIIKSTDAYISSESENKSAYYITNTLVIRCSSDKFDKLVESLEKSGHNVSVKTIEMEDVTAEYVDVQARLKTKRETEERYREILKQARTINEVLEVESYIKIVREEIESAEGRLKYLNDKVSYSTLTLTVQQESDNPYEPGFGDKTGDAFSGGWEILKGIFIVFLYLWPFWIISGITLLIIFRKKIWKKK